MPKFTTGPIENTGTPSATINLKFLNNSKSTAVVRAKVFHLDGAKRKIFDTGFLTIDPKSSAFVLNVDVSGEAQYEVQFRSNLSNKEVQFSSWGFRDNGRVNPSQRVLNSELTMR
ncbi:hypothetical protein [Scopulibacillus cellulosilyticus]|uniref:Uncharacterized protein n=1 Tax=Scopulibacillus cellulosilyticus TaxID=2665665 RepID=A0ABW2PYL3_9BACL